MNGFFVNIMGTALIAADKRAAADMQVAADKRAAADMQAVADKRAAADTQAAGAADKRAAGVFRVRFQWEFRSLCKKPMNRRFLHYSFCKSYSYPPQKHILFKLYIQISRKSIKKQNIAETIATICRNMVYYFH